LKQYLAYALYAVVAIVTLIGCSRKSDSFISRNYHAVTAEYNALYNGGVALDKGLSGLANTFQDDYWKILPVERIQLFEDITRPGDVKNPDFDKAEEKAVKAIQRHSMKIDGEEKNPQMDEAFILLGKSRYYSQRFIAALEAFNYVLAYYPASNNIAQAKIWKEKTNIQLGNNELAIDNLRKLFKVEKNLKDQDQADAYAMLSQAFVNLKHYDTALAYMKDAARLTRKSEQEGRYHFIKGQLYNALSYKDSANMSFDEVIALNRRIPRKYWINAQIEKIRNFDYEQGDIALLLEHIEELEENRENRPFLDKLYYTKAEYYMNIGLEDSAIALYNRSLRQNSQDRYLVSRDYLSLAQYNFDNAEYQLAGAYYDSTLNQLTNGTREHRQIRKKRENLTDVIKYENLSQRNDSIMKLALMPEAEQRAFFEDYIKRLKERAKQDSIRKADIIRNNEFFKKDVPTAGQNTTNSKNTKGARGRSTGSAQVGEFYFYNNTAVAYGKQDFRNVWGNRALEDNWRLSSKKRNQLDGSGVPVDIAPEQDFEKDLNVDTFLATIPKTEKAIDSLKRERDDAYYQLGLIYKEKFKLYPRAADRLEKVLAFQPEERLILPAKYYLYQVYNQMDASAKANSYKSDITSNYPDSRYAAILNNPDVALEQDAESAEAIYNSLYRQFGAQQYATVLEKLDQNIERFYGDPFVPKFELLKATVLGRYQGYEAYKKALNFVAVTYPRSDEGKKAQEILQTTVPSLAFRKFVPDEASDTWKIVYAFDVTQQQQAQDTQNQIDLALETLGYTDFATSLDMYNPNQVFVVVHYLTQRSRAEGLAELLAENKDFKITHPSTVISSDNYRIVQLHKNLDAYTE
jgi:tetratricopeptide (TPR) repeat protein